jgi:hypothetical protein
VDELFAGGDVPAKQERGSQEVLCVFDAGKANGNRAVERDSFRWSSILEMGTGGYESGCGEVLSACIIYLSI